VLSYSGFNDLYQAVIRELDINYRKGLGRPIFTHIHQHAVETLLLNHCGENPFVYYGLSNNKTPVELWLDNTRVMNAISSEFNILFLSFVAPCLTLGNHEITETQKIMYRRMYPHCLPYCLPLHDSDDHPSPASRIITEYYHKLTDSIREYGFINDLTHIFCDYTNTYFDYVHLTDKGNEIVATHIHDVLVKNLGKKKTT
jgi:hypothetical protein